jgi:hypothetical protein
MNITMHIQKILLCLGIVVARLGACAQGTFQNLDFEQAKLTFLPGGGNFISASNAFPGWTLYAGSVPEQVVFVNGIIGGFTPVALADSAPPSLVLDGSFSAILGGPGLSFVTASIAQSGTIPTGSESLRFLSLGQLSVFFAGHSLPLEFLGNGPNASQIYGANISAYAGQYGQLMFQTGPSSNDGINVLDDITFSAQGIPEPGALSILGLGALALCLQRRGRRARPATTR